MWDASHTKVLTTHIPAVTGDAVVSENSTKHPQPEGWRCFIQPSEGKEKGSEEPAFWLVQNLNPKCGSKTHKRFEQRPHRDHAFAIAQTF